MKNNIDFLKINRGVLGVINFNNMIPAHLQDLALVNMKIFPADNDADRAYKNLLADQISWCNSNREVIYGKAQKLYAKVLAKRLNEAIVKRCCDFLKLEAEYRKYCKENELLP